MFLISERERRLLADTKLTRARVDDPVEAPDIRVVDAVPIEVPSRSAPGGALCQWWRANNRDSRRPKIAVRRTHAVRQWEFLRRDVLQELIALVNDFDVYAIAVCG